MTYPLSEGYIVVDTTECAQCYTCMMACSLAHEGVESLALSRIQIVGHLLDRYPNDVSQEVCRQCVTPLCVQSCPTGACHVDAENGNVRTIDESMCIGCQMCVQACPFIPPRVVFNPEKNVAIKCDLCTNTPYWDGEGPACVSLCPAGAIKFVTDVPSQLSDIGYKVDMYEGSPFQRGGWK